MGTLNTNKNFDDIFTQLALMHSFSFMCFLDIFHFGKQHKRHIITNLPFMRMRTEIIINKRKIIKYAQRNWNCLLLECHLYSNRNTTNSIYLVLSSSVIFQSYVISAFRIIAYLKCLLKQIVFNLTVLPECIRSCTLFLKSFPFKIIARKKSNKHTIFVFRLELEDVANMQFNFGLIFIGIQQNTAILRYRIMQNECTKQQGSSPSGMCDLRRILLPCLVPVGFLALNYFVLQYF